MKYMCLQRIFMLAFGLFITISLKAQDLIRRVPQDAKVVVAFNSKAVFDHLNISDLNVVFGRLGIFDKFDSNKSPKIDKIEDFGIDLDAKAYGYIRATDSIQYIGALIPLSNKVHFESIVPNHKKIEIVNSLPTIYSTDRTVRLSWDQNTLYVIAGVAMDYYFRKDEIKSRYGLLETYNDSYEEAYTEEAIVDSTQAIWDEYDFDSLDSTVLAVEEEGDEWPEPPVLGDVDTGELDMLGDDYAIVDSILGQEEYADDYYSKYDSINRHNDSIKTELVKQWTNAEMENLLKGNYGAYNASLIPKMAGNTIAHVHAKDIFYYYQYFYPEDVITDLLGAKPKFDYGIHGVDARIVVEGNKLKLSGTASLDKDMAVYYKEIYNKKLNPKFYPFLDKNALGFLSFNLSTEAYIKNLPKIMERYYGSFMPRYSKAISLGATLFDVLLDEKAIAKVFKGDNLFVLNGVTKVEVNYTDYEYDEDYNYTEVEKTKTETVPQFLWMFSSDDTRIFDKLSEIGVEEEELINHDGIFEVKERKNTGINIYFLIKNGIVFIGNDKTQLESIKMNRIATKGYAPYVAMAKKNNFSMLFNTKRIPVLLEELEIPVDRSLEETVNELGQYGDFYMFSGGVKGKKISGEIALDFPAKKGNALSFLFDVLDRWTLKLKD